MTLGQAARHRNLLHRLRHGQTGARHGPCQEGDEPRSGQHLDGRFGGPGARERREVKCILTLS